MFNGLLSKNYKRSTKGESLSKRLWYILLVMLFVIILCFTVALVYLTSRSRSNFEKSQSETRITAVKTGILSEIQNYNSISRLVMIDDTVLKLLRSKSVDVGLKNDARHSVMKILNVCDNVDSVFVLRNDGDFMSTGRGEYFVDLEKMKNEQWKEPIYEMRGKVMFSINGNGALVKNGLSFLTMSRAIYDINSQDLKGILLMNISTEVLAKIVKEQGTQYICITDLDGNYLVGNAELAEYYSADLPKDVITHRMVRHGVTHEMVSTSFIDDLPLVVICSSSVEYESFGTRCNLLAYQRFGTMLSRNLKRGSANIIDMLELESRDCIAERRENVRRKGEETGTKLLLPMFGMLILVIAIVVVPAFSSF